MVQVSQTNILRQVVDIEDSEITRVDTKRAVKLQAHKRITTKSYQTFHYDYKIIYGSEISYGSFINLKPFCISRPSEKETKMCLCCKYLNLHYLHGMNANELTFRIFMQNLKSSKEDGTNYFHHDCILGKCEKKVQCFKHF